MTAQTEVKAVPQERQKDWAKPEAMAIPKEGYFKFELGKYGPVFPRTPACHGFTLIARIKPGREEAFREHGKTIEEGRRGRPQCPCVPETSLPPLAPVRHR
jgi:hypothetical protein